MQLKRISETFSLTLRQFGDLYQGRVNLTSWLSNAFHLVTSVSLFISGPSCFHCLT